jgi:hypothetical protein
MALLLSPGDTIDEVDEPGGRIRYVSLAALGNLNVPTVFQASG